MSGSGDASSPTHSLLEGLLAEHGLSGDTRLYRETVRGSLTSTDTPGLFRLSANAAPTESVVDVYGQGYVVQAEHVGPGLAFAQTATRNWQETMEMRTAKARWEHASPDESVEVEVVLGEILRQGGLIYPVESVTVERVWYCTLPSQSVIVREMM